MIFIEVDLIGSIQKDIPTFLLLFREYRNWWRFVRYIFSHRIIRSCRPYGLNPESCRLYGLNPGGCLHLVYFWVMFYRRHLR